MKIMIKCTLHKLKSNPPTRKSYNGGKRRKDVNEVSLQVCYNYKCNMYPAFPS